VKQINVWYFYVIGSSISPLRSIDLGVTMADMILPASLAKWALEELIASPPVPLGSCVPEAEQVLRHINSVLSSKDNSSLGFLNPVLSSAVVRFEATLQSALRDLDTYFVSPVGIFSTSALLARAEDMFGENKTLLPPITVTQIKEAGKCLAFSLGSAAAFHLFAALESVLRVYYDKLSGGKPHPKNPSMGAYLGELSQLANVDKKLLAALWQVKDLHRNPAIHFEALLAPGEALTLIGMVQSAIATTLDVVSKIP
jgi:hypothetical protein